MRRQLIALACLLAIALPAQAQQERPWENFDYPQLNEFEMPDMEIFELDNGVRFYLVEDSELPLIDVNVRVRTGGALVPDSKVGLNSLVGTVMRTGGTPDHPGDQLNRMLENRAASMETSIGFTSGSASMNTLAEDFDELLPVFVDLLRNPAFPQERIELAKRQQRTSISRRNEEQRDIAQREFRNLIYGEDSRYSRTVEYATLANITRQDMVDFHERAFVGENLMIGVVGDFEMAAMKAKLREAFSSIPAGEETDMPFPEVDYDYPSSINLAHKSDVNQSYVLMGHIGGMRDNPDYAELQVMNQVLSGGFSSRLMQVVRSEMGLAYSVYGSYGSGNFYPGMFTAGVMTATDTTAEAIEAIIEQIQRLQEEQVSQEELDQTREEFLNSMAFRYTSRGDVLQERMRYDYVGLPPDTFDQLMGEVREVTVEDVHRVAREYLRPDALQILVVGNADEIGDQLESFGEVNEIDISIPPPPDESSE